MNRDLALTHDEGAWPVPRYDPEGQFGRREEAAPALDLPMLLAIAREWRWLIAGAMAAGLVLAVAYALITTPMYRAWVMLQVNPPTVQILNQDSGADEGSESTPWDFVATQVGLLSSRSLAERVAQDLNLANNPAFVSQDQDPAKRLQMATQKVEENLKVIQPDEGQLIQFSFTSDSPRLSAQVAN